MTAPATDLLPLLQDFYRDTLSALLRHQAAARWVSQYDVNNTYQYIINRQETQLGWIGRAIAEQGGSLPDVAVPDRPAPPKGAGARSLIEEDSRDAQAFVDRWSPRIGTLTNVRHARMLRVVIGEVLEQKRFFDQAIAGRVDLLGRRGDAAGARVGEVLPTRWLE